MVLQNSPASSAHTTNSSERGSNTKTMTYKNKLTVCFDDILKVGAEMMMQQQLKNVQLDSYLINGFSQSQQRLLKEKVKLFHGILDDLETSLSQSSSYLETLTAIGKEKEKEREEAEKKRAEQENLRKVKEQEELKKRQELEEASQQQQRQQNSKEKNGLGLNFAATASANTMNANDSRQNYQELGSLQSSNQTPQIENTNAASNGTTFSPLTTMRSQGQQGQPSDAMFNDLNSMDISMFSGLDSTGFDSTAFSSTVDGTKGFDDNNLGNNYNGISISSIENNTKNNTDSIKNGKDNNSKNNDKDKDKDNNNNETNNSNNNNNNNNDNDNDEESKNNDSNGNDNNDSDSNNKNNSSTSGNGNDNIVNNDLQTTVVPNPGDNPPPADNGEEYLTLNDFNDLNIDWSTTGDNGELDLSGFNI
ncbi:Med2p [Saccharomyces paradoxus]|uniref:Med2p n=1 Tax=Saccharomyces paradoxus TaxID=27291 RepID=A0A8B8UNB1_SACPA|nr:Med2 [Saccharomyces paradoxus]QHS72220.1 Med2 [Saccharomyces paradoxus]